MVMVKRPCTIAAADANKLHRWQASWPHNVYVGFFSSGTAMGSGRLRFIC